MRWAFTACDQQLASRLAAELNVSPLVARLLAQRGIHTPEEAARFLNPSLSHLHSPYAMRGMKPAVERLQRAVAAAEPVLTYGDYDVDGTLAIVILKTAIELCGGVVQFHVPHRIREGYGMRDEVIADAAARGIRLIISVDTGIRGFSAATTARELGLDLIVTDHHLTQDGKVPDALAVLNPNQPGCEYPCKSLCGAGVAFKVAQALLEATGRERLLPSFLKMVAIATIADAVPLTGENRVFAKLGLEGLRRPVNAGLKALLDVAALGSPPGGGDVAGNVVRKIVSASDVGFRIAPRLNAAGRMDVACDVIELFTVKDEVRAREIAAKLNQLNADRQQEEARMVREIQERLDGDAAARAPFCLVLDGEGWHRGVIGIVATRVVERYGRPALVISRDATTGEAHGSGRSIPAFHLLDALEAENCRGLFTRFGGHAYAVGFALPCDRIAELRQTLEDYARLHLTAADLLPSTRVDAEIELSEITPDFYDCLRQLEPFGQQNPEPVFAARGVSLRFPPRILKEKHIKLRLGSGNASGFDALGWRMAERMASEALSPGDRLDVAFCIEENSNPEFGGMQLVLRDYVKAAVAVPAVAVASL